MPIIDVRRIPLEPRANLDPKVAAVFRELVASVTPGHFQRCDLVLLEELAGAIHVAREARNALADAELGTPKGKALARLLREQGKLIATLATRARLTPQSRMSKEKAATAANKPSGAYLWKKPWENIPDEIEVDDE